MKAKLPNLELLEYKAVMAFLKDEEKSNKYIEKMEDMGFKIKKPLKWVQFDCEVFKQIWGSTVTAFDVLDNGEPTIGGCAMTEAYTVVFHEEYTDTYIVIVNDCLCYMVSDATSEFLEDLKNHRLASLSVAKHKY